MRYSKIEITGTPAQMFVYYTLDTELFQSKNLKARSEDGLLFYINDKYSRHVLIPESHPLFNINLLSFAGDDVYFNKNRLELEEEIIKKLTPLYISANKEHYTR